MTKVDEQTQATALSASLPEDDTVSPTNDAVSLKQKGNECLKLKDYVGADAKYSEALAILLLDNTETPEQQKQETDSKPNRRDVSVLFTNRAHARISVDRLDDALLDAQDAIRADPTYGKAHFRMGMVLALQGDEHGADEAKATGTRITREETQQRKKKERAILLAQQVQRKTQQRKPRSGFFLSGSGQALYDDKPEPVADVEPRLPGVPLFGSNCVALPAPWKEGGVVVSTSSNEKSVSAAVADGKDADEEEEASSNCQLETERAAEGSKVKDELEDGVLVAVVTVAGDTSKDDVEKEGYVVVPSVEPEATTASADGKDDVLEGGEANESAAPSTSDRLSSVENMCEVSLPGSNDGALCESHNSTISNGSLASINTEVGEPMNCGLGASVVGRVGFSNIGNTCFINSVMQCLLYTAPLVDLVDHIKPSALSLNEARFDGLVVFEQLLSSIREKASKGKGSIAPTQIVKYLKNISTDFKYGMQEDAHMFYCFFLDALQRSCMYGYSGEDVHELEPTTAVYKVFGMEHETRVECLHCHETSRSTTTAFEIHIDAINLNKKAEHTVEAVLEAHTEPEEIEDYKCDKCKKLGVSKRTQVSAPPLVLTVTVQRCGQGAFGKSNVHVLFDEQLDISPLLAPSSVDGSCNGSIAGSICHVSGSCMYDLYAVVVHLDIANSVFFGHYIAFVRVVAPAGKQRDGEEKEKSQWWRLDDSKVRPVTWEVVRSNRAYMLFYRRRD